MMVRISQKTTSNLLLLIGGLYFIIQYGSCLSGQDDEIIRKHPVITSTIIPDYYKSLFKPEIKNKLKLIISYEKKLKDTVSNFLYEGRYNIQIYTLSTMYHFPLNKSLKENHNDNKLEVGVNFYDNERSLINILDRMVVSKSDVPSNIFISLNGNNITKTVKNDNLIDYFINFRNLSIRYNSKSPQEIYAEKSKLINGTIPLELLLVKKEKRLYLLFMSPVENVKLSPETLYNLMEK